MQRTEMRGKKRVRKLKLWKLTFRQRKRAEQLGVHTIKEDKNVYKMPIEIATLSAFQYRKKLTQTCQSPRKENLNDSVKNKI